MSAAPTPAAGLKGIAAVAAGWIHSLAPGSNGHIDAWGPTDTANSIAAGEAHNVAF